MSYTMILAVLLPFAGGVPRVGAGLTDSIAVAGVRSEAEYRFLATNRTSTMQKEIDQAAAAGFSFVALSFGETSFGGKELLVVMERGGGEMFQYRLLATNKTSTLQHEIAEAASAGFRLREATFGETAGGQEAIVVLERPAGQSAPRYSYQLLATKKTSTMGKEIERLAAEGFRVADMTNGNTTFGGREVIVFMEQPLQR